MRRHLIITFIALIQLPWSAGAATTSTAPAKGANPSHSTRQLDKDGAVTKLRAEITKAFVDGDFKKLERFSSSFQSPTAVTAFGNPKNLVFFDDGIDDAVGHFAADDQADWDKALKQADDWMRAYPQSPAAILSKSEILIRRGFKIRGNGYADSVSEDAFRGFDDMMRKAYDLLTSTKPVSSRNPDWYRQMIELSNYRSLDKSVLMALSDEAEHRFPYYFPAFNQGVEYMLPRWHGSDEDVKGYINHVAGSAPADLADVLYARLYIGSSCCAYRTNDIYKLAGAEWPRLKKGIELLRDRYPVDPYIDIEANFACRAGDLKTLRALLPQIGDQPLLEEWSNWRPMFDSCVHIAKAAPANVDSVPILDGPDPNAK